MRLLRGSSGHLSGQASGGGVNERGGDGGQEFGGRSRRVRRSSGVVSKSLSFVWREERVVCLTP